MRIAYENENVTLWHGDCREWSGKADAVVSDPPYGMDLNTDFSGMNGWSGKGHKYEPIAGDDAPFDPAPWLATGKAQVFWGAQYFCHRLPEVGGGWCSTSAAKASRLKSALGTASLHGVRSGRPSACSPGCGMAWRGGLPKGDCTRRRSRLT